MNFDIDDFDNQKIRIGKCYHEAAHAVFAHHSGLKIHDVCVTPAGEGSFDFDVPDDPGPLFASELATVLLAGEYAEYHFYGSRKPGTFEAFEQQVRDDPKFFDFPMARKFLELAAADSDNPRGGVREHHQVADEATVSKVARWWPEIVAVARRLEQSERLNGDRVANVLEGLW